MRNGTNVSDPGEPSVNNSIIIDHSLPNVLKKFSTATVAQPVEGDIQKTHVPMTAST